MLESHTVVALRTDFRRPAHVAAAIGLFTGMALAVGAESPWTRACGLVLLIGVAFLLVLVHWPRQGELLRLVLDRPRRTLYWAHRGGEAEELPFPAVRAVAVEDTPHPRVVLLWAVDTSGRWVNMGQGDRSELEGFAREMANVMDVPLWYRDSAPEALRNHSVQPPFAR